MAGAGAKTVASEETELGAVLIAAISTNPYMQFTPLVSVWGVPIFLVGSLGKIVKMEKIVSMQFDLPELLPDWNHYNRSDEALFRLIPS